MGVKNMSTNARMTLIGLYNYDSTLFDGLTLPTGYDKSLFIDTLLLEHGEKCVLYSDPEFMKYSIGAIGRKWYHELERIYLTLTEDYNPLYNFDRNETYFDQIYGTNSEATTGWKGGGYTRTNNPEYFDEQTVNGYSNQTLDSTTETVTDAKTTEKVSAFNSSTYEPSKETTENGGKQKSNAGKIESNAGTMKHHGKTEDIAENYGENSNGSVTGSEQKAITHTAQLYGNIGVTTSQQMAKDEIELRKNYNLYGTAAGIFANELLIQVF
jgi:hypothetical protein